MPTAKPSNPNQTGKIKIILEYEGTRYRGWQRQPNAATIQGTLEAALHRITGVDIQVTGAGRTDAGVHALGQTAHFQSHLRLDETAWVRALNSHLPDDILVRHAAYVSDEFHARYSARSKTYEYRVLNHPLPSVFLRHAAWHVHKPLDLDAMREAAPFLLGTHDFSSFRAAECGAKNPVRTLRRLDVDKLDGNKGGQIRKGIEGPAPQDEQVIAFVLEAESFLHHMVRNIVGTLIEVGQGKRPPGEIADILNARDRRRAGVTAPAHGLWLIRVEYSGEDEGASAD